MAIVQKLIIDYSKSNQFQIIVRDETGEYNPSNTEGYGEDNGSPVSQFSRYIFDIYNLNTNQSYRQIQSDNINNPDEFYNPSIARIANKENVTLDADNVGIISFDDGVYKITMNTEIDVEYLGNGYIDNDVVVNVPGAKTLFENYNAIIVENEIYEINSYEASTLILNRPVVTSFTSFKPILKTSETFVLNDKLNDCLDKKIAQILSNCNCEDNTEINIIAEAQMLDWGLKRSILKEDYLQAKDYIDLLYKVCNSLNCGCK